jgi:hypothetical protein
MPSKIAEAQLHHAAEQEGLLSLTLAFNGDPVNSAVLDNFAFEVKERFKVRKTRKGSAIRAFVQQKKTLPSDSLKPVIAAALPTSSAGRHEPAFSSFESEHRPSVCLARRSVQSAIWV